MIELKINAKGKSESDLTLALEEIIKKINQGYTSGTDSNDTGNYDFDISGEKTVYVRDLLDKFPILYDYDYKWRDSKDYRDIKQLLDELGYELIEDEVKSGDYNDIKGYFGCEVRKK